MNVLILTPDAVGSTLLQRLITIYMQFHGYDRPVINLHELSNGLARHYNQRFGQEILGKKDATWGYHQSLEQIVELLSSVDHYKTSRLAHYHINNRQDSMADQIPFYQYLNDNFYIISCRRHNLFEHALSWCLNKVTKKLNVYTADEKIDSFFELYKDGIDLDPNSLIQTLNAYKSYLKWCDDHFDVASYFYYEEHLPRIENYILNLPIFSQNKQLTWKDNFGITFDQWNMCHYFNSDLGTVALNSPEKLLQLAAPATPESAQQDPTQTAVATVSRSQALIELLPDAHKNFIKQYQTQYQDTALKINTMVEDGIMMNAPPIKKQTLSEKKRMIRNYQSLLKTYNQWIERNPDMGVPLTVDVLEQFAQIENSQWNPTKSAVVVSQQQTDR